MTTTGPRPSEAGRPTGILSRIDRRVYVGLHALTLTGLGLLALAWADRAIGWEAHLGVSWLVVMGLFLLVEATALHIEIRRETHTLSLSGLPLLLGLLSLGPAALVAARLVGSGFTLVAIRRRFGLKLVWNLALYTAETATAALIAAAALGGGRPDTIAAWVILLAAVLAAELIGLISVPIVIMIAESELRLSLFGQIGRSQMIAAVSATFGIVAAAAMLELTWLAAFAVVPLVGVGYLLHLFGRLGREHHDLQQLHSFTTAIAGRDPVDAGLEQLATILRASGAGLAARTDEGMFSAVVHRDGQREERIVVVGRARRPTDGVVVMSGASEPDEMVELLRQLGGEGGLGLEIADDTGGTGYLFLLDRLGASNQFRDDEVKLFGTLGANLASRMSASKLADRLELQARTDALTGLANRGAVERDLERRLADDEVESVAVIMLDLDRFKDVNDSLGHQFGDALLRLIGDRLEDQVRDDDLIGRLGGDEFAVILEPSRDHDLDRQLDSLHQRLTAPAEIDGITLEVGSSMGVACWPDDADNAAELLRLADIAMYEAKRTHRRWGRYDPHVDHASADRLALLGQLREAIAHRHLRIHLQPQVDATSRAMVAAEALIRWHHPERGLISPADFLPLVEQSSLAGSLTRHVVDEAIAAIGRLDAVDPDLAIWINLTARDLLDESLPATVATRLLKAGVTPSRLGFEVTESSLIINIDTAIATLAALRDLGCRTSVDDFGTGFASLQYLQRLPVDEVKIDQSFVREATTDPQSAAIVRSTTRLVQDLGRSVVAEGVEDEETLDLLASMGCDVVQGYLISRPLDIDAFVEWASNYRPATAIGS